MILTKDEVAEIKRKSRILSNILWNPGYAMDREEADAVHRAPKHIAALLASHEELRAEVERLREREQYLKTELAKHDSRFDDSKTDSG